MNYIFPVRLYIFLIFCCPPIISVWRIDSFLSCDEHIFIRGKRKKKPNSFLAWCEMVWKCRTVSLFHQRIQTNEVEELAGYNWTVDNSNIWKTWCSRATLLLLSSFYFCCWITVWSGSRHIRNMSGSENSWAPPLSDVSPGLSTVYSRLIMGKLLTDLHFDCSLHQQRLFRSHMNLPHFVSRLQLWPANVSHPLSIFFITLLAH